MKTEKVLEKINIMKNRFVELKNIRRTDAKEEYYQMAGVLERIIDRIYPVRDAQSLKGNLVRGIYFAGPTTEAEEQKDFIYDIDLKLRVIDTILQEHELFGFDNFEPIKKTKETEWQLGSDKIGFFKKRTMEK